MTPAQAAAFSRDGFAVLEQFLAGDEVAQVQSEVDALVLEARDGGCTRPHNTLVPLRWHDAVVERILASGRRIRALRDAVRADDLRWISGYISIKEPKSAPLWWHQDWWCWDHAVTYRQAAPQVAVLCYLAATDAQYAALRVLPGSHLRSASLHDVLPEAHSQTSSELDPDHPALSDDPDQVTLPAQPGDAVVVDYRLLHGTHENAGGSRRDCVLLSFTPSWRDLPRDVRAHLVSHSAQPATHELAPKSSGHGRLLPSYRGARRSLSLNRTPPPRFEVRATTR